MRYLLLLSALIIVNLESSYSSELNNFFSGELKFIQTSLNKDKNSFEESEGVFKRLDDKSIVIEDDNLYGLLSLFDSIEFV